MDQDWVWSGLVQPLKDPILSDLIGYQTRPDPIRSDSVGGPISITIESHSCVTQFSYSVLQLFHSVLPRHTQPLHPKFAHLMPTYAASAASIPPLLLNCAKLAQNLI